MTAVHTKATVIKLGASNVSQYCNSSTFGRTADSHDLTTYGKDDHVYGGGLGDGTAQIGGIYDSTAVTGPRAVIEPLIGTTIVYTRQVEGTGSGKPQDVVNAVVKGYVETSPVAGYVTWSADLQLSDAINSTPQA